MYKNDVIEKYLRSGDVISVRECICGFCYTDRNFSTDKFDGAIQYVQSQGMEIFEKYNGKPLLIDAKSEFTEQEYEDAVHELKKNFCKERISEVKKIGRAIYGEPKAETLKKNGTLPKELSHQDRKNHGIIVGGVLVAAVIIIVLCILLVK